MRVDPLATQIHLDVFQHRVGIVERDRQAAVALRVRQRAYFASVMVKEGHADGLVTGLTTSYADAIRAPLQIIGTRAGRRAAGVYIVVTKNDFKFFADCTVNADPTAEELADIAVTTAELTGEPRWAERLTPENWRERYHQWRASRPTPLPSVRKPTNPMPDWEGPIPE